MESWQAVWLVCLLCAYRNTTDDRSGVFIIYGVSSFHVFRLVDLGVHKWLASLT